MCGTKLDGVQVFLSERVEILVSGWTFFRHLYFLFGLLVLEHSYKYGCKFSSFVEVGQSSHEPKEPSVQGYRRTEGTEPKGVNGSFEY